MKGIVGVLYWSLYVRCPRCGETNDLSSEVHDGDNDVARRIFTNRWDMLKGFEVECEFCGSGFCMDSVEY